MPPQPARAYPPGAGVGGCCVRLLRTQVPFLAPLTPAPPYIRTHRRFVFGSEETGGPSSEATEAK